MKNSTKVVLDYITTQTSLNGLYAIQGALFGYYTSPLLKDFGVDKILEDVKECDRDLAKEEVNKQFYILAKAKELSTRVVGYYTMNGLKVPEVTFDKIPLDLVKKLRGDFYG